MSSLLRLLAYKFSRATRGNVTIIFALSFVGLIIAAGGATDLHSAFSTRADMQDALDAAVIAGVRASSDQMSPVASATFNENVKANVRDDVSQTYSVSSSSSSNTSATVVETTMRGTAKATSSTYFLKLIGVSHIDLTVSSAAAGTKTLATTATPCIYILDPSGSQAMLVNSGAKVTAPNCEVDIKSTGNPAGMFNSGSSLNFKKVCVQGSQVTQNSTTVANLQLNCTTQNDPYSGNTPTPDSSTCTYSNGNYNDATVSLSPGVYCGWFNFNSSSAKVTLAPGVYVIKSGGWNVNGGTWTGSGVTFYFADTSKIQFNSGISATLSAPTSGTYKNLLFYEASGLSKSDFIFNDSVANNLTGVIWLPSRTVTWNASSGVASDSLTMVVWRIILNNTTWTLNPLSGSTSGSTSTSAMTNIRLVS